MDRIAGKNRPTYGVLLSHCRGQYILEIFAGIESAARELDVNLILLAGRSIHSPYPNDIGQNIIYDVIDTKSLDGIILSSLLFNYATQAQADVFMRRFAAIPIVTTNIKFKGVPSVCSDNKSGFRALIKHLILEHHYKKIAFIQGPVLNPDASERFGIFKETLAEFDLNIDPRLIAAGDFTYNSGRTAALHLVDKQGIGKNNIDVIVAANDAMAFGAIDGLAGRGIGVPADIAVTGFDNILDAGKINVPLTTVHIPLFEIGRQALLALHNAAADVRQLELETLLVTRQSCGCSVPHEPVPKHRTPLVHTDADPPAMGDVLLSEYYLHQLIYINDSFHQCRTLQELNTQLLNDLPTLGIDKGYLFLFRPQHPGTFTLVPSGNQSSQTYDFNKIIGSLPAGSRHFSYCALPLVCKGEQLGFILIEINTLAWFAYESIQSQLSTALKSIFLLDEIGSMNKDLEKANRKLRVADEQKTRFFINIAHETRTPLTLIKNYMEKCIRAHQTDPDLRIVKQNIDLLLANMINFLDAKKLERGKIIYDHGQTTDLTRLIADKVVLFREVAVKRQMAITTDIADGVYVYADPWALDRVLNNLLDNAIKYGCTRGTIAVLLKAERNIARLCVADDGPGIEPDKIVHIGKPYYQLSHPKSGRQGIGMGLYIVKKILDTLGGEFLVESIKDSGTVITITLPGSTQSPGSSADFVISAPQDIPLLSAMVREAAGSPDKDSILVVDDNTVMLGFLQTSLEAKYNVFTAAGVEEALLKLTTIPRPGIIVSDVMMDDIDGHTFLETVTGDERYHDIPFIFLTAKHDKDDKLSGLAHGAIDYIVKPFSIDELSYKIAALIGLRKKQRGVEASRLKKDLISYLSAADIPADDHNYFTIEKICTERKLSVRERQVVCSMLQGLPNKRIAAALHISLRTVEFHIINIYKKLAVRDRNEIYALFREKT